MPTTPTATLGSRPGRWRAPLILLVLALAAPATVGAALAAPPSTDPGVDAAMAAAWLADQLDPAGYLPGPTDDPDVGGTLEVALGLAASGVEADAFAAAVGWLQTNVATVIAPYGTDLPGNLGYLLLVADAAGIDPTAFGGVDLVARLGATLGTYEAGLYGADDPTYDGAFRQSLALLGLAAHGLTPPAAAVTWLADQQCDAPAAALGGWQAYRADTLLPCDPPDPVAFTGPDTNSTALALTATSAVPGAGDVAAGLGFLAAAQTASGWAYVPGGDADTNSTALVILGLVSAGEDPTAADWTVGGTTALAALLAWQLGCDAESGDVAAFASPYSSGLPDTFATRQAVFGSAGRPWPLGPVSFGPTPDACAPEPSTTSTQPAGTASTTTTSAPAAVVAPAFTG